MVNKFIGENMIYDIANLKVEIKNENGRTEKQAIPYLAQNQDEKNIDITIDVDEKTPIIVSVDEVPLFFIIVIAIAKQIENKVAPHIGSIPPKSIPRAIPVKAPCPNESAKKDILLLTTIVESIPNSGVTIKIANKAFFIKL